MTVMEKFLTVEEVAHVLRKSPDTVLRLIKRKELIAYKVSGTWRIMPDDFQRYLDAIKSTKPEQES